MQVKYQRTSTSNQKGDRFSLDKTAYDLILFDQGVSGTLKFKERTEARKLIPLVESGELKELVVEELRDIGRSMVDTIATLGWLDDNKVNVVIRSMGNLSSRVNDKPNEIWSLISAVLASVYQLEKENLRSRTLAGREAYVRLGGKLGRPAKTNESVKKFLDKPKSQQILSLLKKGKSVRDVSARLNVSSSTVMKVKNLINHSSKKTIRKNIYL